MTQGIKHDAEAKPFKLMWSLIGGEAETIILLGLGRVTEIVEFSNWAIGIRVAVASGRTIGDERLAEQQFFFENVVVKPQKARKSRAKRDHQKRIKNEHARAAIAAPAISPNPSVTESQYCLKIKWGER